MIILGRLRTGLCQLSCLKQTNYIVKRVLIARFQTYVSTNWLSDRLSNISNDRELRVLDASYNTDKSVDGFREFHIDKQHIPGALYYDLHRCVDSTKYIPRNLPHLNCFQEYVQNLGVFGDTHVVTYDMMDTKGSARLWWMFRLFGHENVSILDGGLGKWIADGYDMTSEEHFAKEKSDFSPVLNPALIRDYDVVMKNVSSQETQMMDARSISNFHGEELSDNPDLQLGHIPGARNVHYRRLYNEDWTLKSHTELKSLFSECGIDLSKPIISSCHTAMTACNLAAAAHMLGNKDVAVYYGSWLEWGQRAPASCVVSDEHEE